MAILFYGSLLFVIAFALHLIIWRIHLPKRQTKVLLLVFFGVLGCGSFIFHKYALKLSILGLHPPGVMSGYFQIWLYFISLTLAYMITYSAIEADSPSLLIIKKISEAGASGLSKEILEREMDDNVLIKPRLKDLLIDRMAEQNEGKYRLRPKGFLVARVFIFYRNLIRANKGG